MFLSFWLIQDAVLLNRGKEGGKLYWTNFSKSLRAFHGLRGYTWIEKLPSSRIEWPIPIRVFGKVSGPDSHSPRRAIFYFPPLGSICHLSGRIREWDTFFWRQFPSEYVADAHSVWQVPGNAFRSIFATALPQKRRRDGKTWQSGFLASKESRRVAKRATQRRWKKGSLHCPRFPFSEWLSGKRGIHIRGEGTFPEQTRRRNHHLPLQVQQHTAAEGNLFFLSGRNPSLPFNRGPT